MANPKATLQANQKAADSTHPRRETKRPEDESTNQIEEISIHPVPGQPIAKDCFILIGEHPILHLQPRGLNGKLNQDNNEGGQRSQTAYTKEALDAPAPNHIETLDLNPVVQNQHDDSEGWTVVQRKRKNFNSNQFRKTNQPSPLDIHAKKLRQQYKCFKCLVKGHVQAVCANPRRCLHCTESGHIIKNCPILKKGIPKVTHKPNSLYKRQPMDSSQIGNTSNQFKHIPPDNHPKSDQGQPVEPPNNMEELRDWQTMPMNAPGGLWQRRPTSLNVYITPRETLSPANRFLEQSAFIFAGPGHSDPDLKRRIAHYMARHFNRDPKDFAVFTINEDFGDSLLIFPNPEMAEEAINIASFYVGNSITVTLHPYSPHLQMAFNPLCGRARVKLYGVPLQHWNRIDMATLVAGFGYPLRVAPYFTNGNYDYLTMLIACKDPEEVPFNLNLNVNPHEKDIRVELDGWLKHTRAPRTNQGGGSRQIRRDRDGGNRGRGGQSHLGGGNIRNTARRLPEGHRNGGGDRNRDNRLERGNSSEGSNWSRPIFSWIQNLKERLVKAGIVNGTDGSIITNSTHAIKDSPAAAAVGSKMEASQEISKVVTIFDSGAKVCNNSGMLLFNVVIKGPMFSLQPQTAFCGLIFASGELLHGFFEKFMAKPHRKDYTTLQIVQVAANENLIKEVNDFLKKNGPPNLPELGWATGINGEDNGLGLDWEGPPPGFEKPIYLPNQTISHNVTLQLKDVEQGPPPGFEKPIFLSPETGNTHVISHQVNSEQTPDFTVVRSNTPGGNMQVARGRKRKGTGHCLLNSAQVRRSERLKKKLSADKSKESNKKRIGKPKVAINKIKLDYLQSLSPLNKTQAELVVNMAGVELRGGIEEEVNKMVWN
ncbi:Gag polyprotein [Carex littledalei]|uniref:Gag polyprotein n=1 Tax=Carex littledalei TaxID=544730 RepID=A0A833QYL0_9POAL|nr:Gag polyprotein [Carex littledalei]